MICLVILTNFLPESTINIFALLSVSATLRQTTNESWILSCSDILH